MILCGEKVQDSLRWCASLKEGIKIIEPDEDLAYSNMDRAKSSLKSAERDFSENDLHWATVKTYYAEYYSIYSFLQKIGIKCENHYCSILAVGRLIGMEKIKVIEEHRSKRLDAQYYLIVGKEAEVNHMIKSAKSFVAEFYNFISSLNKKDIENYRNLLITYIK